MSSETWIELNDYLRSLFNMTRTGDLIVPGLSILENTDNNDAKLDISVVKKSIEYLLKRHPLMRAYIERCQNKVFFKLANDDASRSEVIEGVDLVSRELSSRQEMIAEMEEFTKKKLDYDNKCKLWKAALYSFLDEKDNGRRKYAVVFLLPLYMTDALNITSLSLEISNLINAILSGVECEEMRTVLPIVDSAISLIMKEKLLGPQQLQFIEEMKKHESTAKFKLDPKFASQTGENGSKYNLFRINKTRTKSLVSKCKKRGIKFTGFLMTTIFYSIKELYVENGLEPPKEQCACVTINMRFRYKQPVDYSSLGFFSGLVPIEFAPPNGKYEDIWNESKLCDSMIQERSDMKSGALFMDLIDHEHLSEVNKLFEDESSTLEEALRHTQAASKCDIYVSNIGTYLINAKRPEPRKPFELKELYYGDTLNSTPSGGCAFIYHLGLWDDELMFLNTSDKARIAPKYSDRLMGLLENLFNSIADSTD